MTLSPWPTPLRVTLSPHSMAGGLTVQRQPQLRPVQQENRDTLLTANRYTTLTLEPIGDGEVCVRTTSWQDEVVILCD